MDSAVDLDTRAAVVPKEFLTFRLGAQEYGIDVLKVQKLRGCAGLSGNGDAACFPDAIDVGGCRVPLVDLRCCFKLERIASSMFTVAILLDLGGRAFALMVDSVSDVVRLPHRHIRPVPDSWTGADVQYLIGIGMHEERKLILLDIERLMSSAELSLMDASLH